MEQTNKQQQVSLSKPINTNNGKSFKLHIRKCWFQTNSTQNKL